MEILYLYITNYKNIKNSENSFYSIKINYDYKKNTIELNDSLEEINNKIKSKVDFFSSSQKIKNITAIIGKNGSGKTSLLRCLAMSMMAKWHDETFENSKYILLVREDNKIKMKTNIKNLKFNNEIIEKLNGKSFVNYLVHSSRNLENFPCYSSICNNGYFIESINNTNKFEYSGPVDSISSKNNYFLYQLFKKIIKNKKDEKQFNSFNIKLPTEIRLESYLETFYLDSKEFEICNCIFGKNFYKTGFNDKIFFLENIFIYLIRNKYINTSALNTYKVREIINQTGNVNYCELIDFICKENLNYLQNERIIELKWLIENKDQLNIKFITVGLNKNERILRIALNIDDKKFENIFTKIKFLLEEGKLFNFNFDIKFSTGEENILFFISNFYNILVNLRKRKNYCKSFTLFMDETETGLHPEWQRRYIDYIIQILELIIEKEESIQLFLTSHSPFLISDLPSENIIFLNKESKEEILTFGANIHELVINGFFMESAMGEFAIKKIKKIIKNINSIKLGIKLKENEKMSDEEINYIIKNIGEKIIKEKIKKMYNETIKENEKTKKLINEYTKEELQNALKILKSGEKSNDKNRKYEQ